MIKLTKQLVFKDKILPTIKLLKEHPSNAHARIALATLNHYLGQSAVNTEESLNIYDRKYFILALHDRLNKKQSHKARCIYLTDLKSINSDGLSEYFLLRYNKTVSPVDSSDVLNVITALLNK